MFEVIVKLIKSYTNLYALGYKAGIDDATKELNKVIKKLGARK